MTHAIIIKGRVTGPRSIEVDEPLTEGNEVEVIVRGGVRPDENDAPPRIESLVEFIKSLPPGTRTKADIDRQIREERDSWGDR